MTPDPRFHRYLTEQARQIDLPTVSSNVIVERAGRRRRRRRVGQIAVTATVVALLGVLVATNGGNDRAQQVASGSANPAEPATLQDSPLDWTMVTPARGLESDVSNQDADVSAVVGGEVYTLTAPAPGAQQPFGALALSRSDDGTNWDEVALPDGLEPTAIAADGDRLDVAGTRAGSPFEVRLASMVAGGAWTEVDLPLPEPANGSDFPGTVSLGPPAVASFGGRTVVTVALGGQLDLDRVLPEGARSEAWAQRFGGLVKMRCNAGPPTSTVSEMVGDCPNPVEEMHSWDDLGISRDTARLADGQVHVFAGEGTAFSAVATLPQDSEEQRLVASADGFWLVTTPDGGSSVVRSSPDGSGWTAPPEPLGGTASGTGVLDGRAAMITEGPEGRVRLAFLSGASTEPVDLHAVLGLDPAAGQGVDLLTIGPLGLAGLVYGGGPRGVVYSPDGTTFSRTTLPSAEPGTNPVVAGITVTTDAVTVRLVDEPTGETPANPTSRLRVFVGAPRP